MREATRLAGLAVAALVVMVVLTTGVNAEPKSIDIVTTKPSCPWPCPDYYQPVCGNNGKTYANPCRLHEAIACENSCIQQVAVGPCVSSCPEVCIEIYQPVCGSDGRTYGNTCHLGMARCKDPCVEFVHEGECAGDGGGGGEPGCQTICPKVYDPVCGSNSKTYDNLCKLNNAQRCESRCITLRAQGPCAHTCGNPCPFSNEGVCGTDGNTYPNQCMLEEAACHNPCLAARHKGPCKNEDCPRICTADYKPVCGSNSKTYSNLCALNSATVCDDPCITLRHEGPCEHACGEPCPLLDQQLDVCGSDGTTYLSKCHLEEAACQNPCLTLQHNGPCGSGSQGCAILCPLHIDPVCGTDGKTYSNMCALTATARCNNDPCLSLRAVGPCSRECGDPCPRIIDGASVCGSDGTMYPSQCHLEEAACHNHCLVMEDESQCDSHPCPMVCPFFFDPVCGTNGITYMNLCTLNNASVCIGDCIRLRGKGPCSRECGDPCPAPGPSDAVCGSDGITYLSQCHLDEAACRNPCISTAHTGPCGGSGSGSRKCCIEGTRIFPEVNVKMTCRQGLLLAESTGQISNPGGGGGGVCRFAGRGYDLGEHLTDLCILMMCTVQGWVPIGPISDCCAHCLLYGDMHVFTFDNELYHFYDSCNYTVTQVGSSFNPPVGVFTTPVPCKENQYPCFSSTTFKNSPQVVITIHHNDIYKVNVNGVDFEVPESGVMVLENYPGGVNDFLPDFIPVLAWRGSCGTFLAGSSGITVLVCPHRLDVWASASLLNQLGGLCGNYDGSLINEFQSRSGTNYDTNPWPIAFPVSWRSAVSTTSCKDLGRRINVGNPCTAVEMWLSVYRRTCTALLENYKSNAFMLEGMIYNVDQYIENCIVDVCRMHTGGAPHQEMQDWLDILSTNLNVTLILGRRRAESNDESNGCDTVTTAPPCTTVTVTATTTVTTATTTTRTTTATTRVITTTTRTSTSTTTTILPVTTTFTTTTTVTIPITPYPLPTITSTVTVHITPYPPHTSQIYNPPYPPHTSQIYNPPYPPHTSQIYNPPYPPQTSQVYNSYTTKYTGSPYIDLHSSEQPTGYVNPYSNDYAFNRPSNVYATGSSYNVNPYVPNPYDSSLETTSSYGFNPYINLYNSNSYIVSHNTTAPYDFVSPYVPNPYDASLKTTSSYGFNPYINTYGSDPYIVASHNTTAPYDFNPYVPNLYGTTDTTTTAPYDFNTYVPNPYEDTYTTTTPYTNPYLPTTAIPYGPNPYIPNPYDASHTQFTYKPSSVVTYSVSTTVSSYIDNPYGFDPYKESTSKPYGTTYLVTDVYNPYGSSQSYEASQYNPYGSSQSYEASQYNPYGSSQSYDETTPYRETTLYNPYGSTQSYGEIGQYNNPYDSTSPYEDSNSYVTSVKCETKLCPFKCVPSSDCTSYKLNETYWCSRGCVCCLLG